MIRLIHPIFQIYSSKFRLSVLDLTRIDLATKEDKLYHIDYWASLFKSTTWEEITMLAQKDSMIQEASNTIYQLTQEEQIRLQCEAREDYYYWKRINDNYVKRLEEDNAQKDAIIARKEAAIADKNAAIANRDALIAELQAKLDAINCN